MFVTFSDLEYICSKNFSNSIDNALNFNDVYLTLSQASDIINNDIQRKVNEHISKQK